MAYLDDFSFLEAGTSASTSHTAVLPLHTTDDLLLVIVTQDGLGTITCGTTGWAQVGSTQASSANTSQMWYKVAASSSETAPAFSSTASDGWVSVTLLIKDADTSTPIDAYAQSTTGSSQVSNYTQAGPTTTSADCLIIYAVCPNASSTAGYSHLPEPPAHHILALDNAGVASYTEQIGAAWHYKRSTGAAQTISWWGANSTHINKLAVAIKNKSGGRIPAYADATDTPVLLSPHPTNATINSCSYSSNLPTTIAGKTSGYDAATSVVDVSINPFTAAVAMTPTSTAATNTTGFTFNMPSTNFSSSFLVGGISGATIKDASVLLGTTAEGGFLITPADASNNYHAYQVFASDSEPNPVGYQTFSIYPSQTTTALGTSGTLSTSAVTRIHCTINNPKFSCTMYIAEFYKVNKIVVAGGDANNPIREAGMGRVGSAFRLPMIIKSGASSLLSYVPIQIGGGDAVNFQIDSGALQFPRIYDTSRKELSFHAGAGNIGITYYGVSGDTIKHTNSIVTSPSVYYWSIHASATSSATWDFTGLKILNAIVTLKNVMTFDQMTFAKCTSIDATGCALTNCVVTDVASGNDTLTTNASTTFTNCDFDVSDVASGNRYVSVANPEIFTNCTFTGGGGHAIRITTAGTYDFTNLTFNGFGADGSDGAAILNDSGGSVTINVAGGNTPTYKNGSGASTTVNAAAASITLTGLPSGSAVRIMEGGSTTTVLASTDSSSTTFYYGYTYAPSTEVDIRIVPPAGSGYQIYELYSYTLTNSNSSIPISFQIDRQYNNP